jgi:hypothetical protein
MPLHFPDGDLRRRFLRVAVHPRAEVAASALLVFGMVWFLLRLRS